jgi:peptide deformylase
MEIIKYTKLEENQENVPAEVLEANKVLRTECKEVVDFEAVKPLIAEMKAIIDDPAAPGLGLAAPQVGQSLRILVMRTGIQSTSSKTLEKEIMTVINPEIIKIVGSKTVVFREGCLSIPGKLAIIQRPKEVKVKFQDENGNPRRLTFKGGDSVVFCHEYDHLLGILMVDRALQMQDMPKPVEPLVVPPLENKEVKAVDSDVVITEEKLEPVTE